MAARRRSILKAAIGLFEKHGYLRTTMDDIAAAAGVTKRTLYHHVGSKEKLLGEIYSEFIDDSLRRWEAVVGRGGSATEVLRGLIAEHIRTVAANRRSIAVFFEEAKHLDPDSRLGIAAQRDTYEDLLRAVIARASRTESSGTGPDVSATALLVLGGLTDMYRWYRPVNRAAEEATIRRFTGMLLDGVATA